MDSGFPQDYDDLIFGIASCSGASNSSSRIYRSEGEAIRAAVIHALQRDPDTSDLDRTTTKRVPEIDGSFVFFDRDCIGMISHYRPSGQGMSDAFLFTPATVANASDFQTSGLGAGRPRLQPLPPYDQPD